MLWRPFAHSTLRTAPRRVIVLSAAETDALRRATRLLIFLAGSAALSCQSMGGDPATNEPYSFEILSSEECALPTAGAQPQRTLLGVKVRLKSHTDLGVPANYYYGSVLTKDGARYLAELPGCQPVLSGPPLRKGQSAEGYLNFPVPPQKTAETVVYLPAIGKLTERERLTERKLSDK